MEQDRLAAEVDANYDVFQRSLARLLPEHKGQYALLRHCELVDFFDKPGDAYRSALSRFPDEIFSIQEITEEPIDLGFFSHVGH